MYKDINAMTRSFDIQIEYKYHNKLHYISWQQLTQSIF